MKFTPQGGKVEIIARYHPNTGAIIFVVQDNGQGMSVSEAEGAFKPYTHAAGPTPHGDESTGLGLGIVSRLMDDMKGSVSLSSEKGVGTTVRLAFPPSVTRPSEARPDDITKKHMDQITRQALAEDQVAFPISRKN